MRFITHAILWTLLAGFPASVRVRSRVSFLACISESLLMRATFLAAVTSVLSASSCFSAPFVSGEITELLGRTTTWSVYDEFAIDNPLPSSGEFTYVYNVENIGAAPFQLWQFGLLVDSSDLSSTGISGGGVPPTGVSPGLWQWWVSGGSPLTLAPNERSVDLVVTSSLAPGPVLAQNYGCNPLICDIGVTAIIGPAVPEPATWLVASLFSSAMFLGRRSGCLFTAHQARIPSKSTCKWFFRRKNG